MVYGGENSSSSIYHLNCEEWFTIRAHDQCMYCTLRAWSLKLARKASENQVENSKEVESGGKLAVAEPSHGMHCSLDRDQEKPRGVFQVQVYRRRFFSLCFPIVNKVLSSKKVTVEKSKYNRALGLVSIVK